jgi:putative inorganic carbon (HCO3(-)) transporter
MRSMISSLLGSKALIRISLAIMVIALVMSRSRMGNTAFFASMTIIGLLALVLIKQRTKGLTILIVSMIIIDLFIVSAWFGLEKVQTRLAETSATQETRDEVVLDALPMLHDFALTGSGGGTFYSVFPMYQKSEVFGFYDHAHNDYLQTAIELGIPAFLLLAAIVLICLYKSLRAMRQRKQSILKGSAFASSMGILGMLIHMSVDYPLQAPANASYFVVFLALGLIVSDIKIRRRRQVVDNG